MIVSLALGDRFEMFAAVVSGVPSQYPLRAYSRAKQPSALMMHSGFDNTESSVHFACAEAYKERIITIRRLQPCFNTEHSHRPAAILRIDETEEFMSATAWILASQQSCPPCILKPFSYEKNILLPKLLRKLAALPFQLVITNAMPTPSESNRKNCNNLNNSERVHLFENLGTIEYLSCIKYAKMLIGNTSSGFYVPRTSRSGSINLESAKRKDQDPEHPRP
jgi:GDP/UDP-N,N'-diacetylbacillosamine 2-epimerase (hydrolysing)